MDKIKPQNIGGMKWSHPYLIVPVSKRSLNKTVQFTENFLGPSGLAPQKLLALSYFISVSHQAIWDVLQYTP